MNGVWRTLSLPSIVIKIGNVRARDSEASGRKGPIPRLGSQIIPAARIAVRKFGTRRPLVRIRANKSVDVEKARGNMQFSFVPRLTRDEKSAIYSVHFHVEITRF